MELEPGWTDEGLAILVVGNDTLMEALPARPIQLAHACRQLGFDLVVPLSWGDELVAEGALQALERRPPEPAVFCACPVVRHRLSQRGNELAPAMVSLVSPPTALGRHLRSTYGTRLRTLVFAGRCPSARSPEYDLSFDPAELMAILRERGVSPVDQPDVFDDVLPPDRRRFASLPGGCPAPDILWHRCHERVLVDLEGDDLPLELGQLLLAPRSLLVDVAPALGCSCSGVTTATTGRAARIAVASVEPPRASAPVVEAFTGIDLTHDPRIEEMRVTPPLGRETATPIASHREPASGQQSAAEQEDAGRPPIAITPPSALKIPLRPFDFGGEGSPRGDR